MKFLTLVTFVYWLGVFYWGWVGYHWFVPFPMKQIWGEGIQKKYPVVYVTLILFFVKRYAAFYTVIVNFYYEIAVRKPIIWRISDGLADFQVRSCLVPYFLLGFDCFTRKLHKAVKPWIHPSNPLAFQASHLYQQIKWDPEVVLSLSSLKQFYLLYRILRWSCKSECVIVNSGLVQTI